MTRLLDIERSARRDIKSGLQYDHLFPSADLLDKVVYRDGNVKDTIRAMQNVVLKYLDDTRLIAPRLKENALRDTCRKIWDFIYSHCQYKLDKKGLEQLRRPARSWHDRSEGIDCDCYSIFVSSILTNLDISHSFRVTKYDDDWQHVYVIVPNGSGHHTIDCVAHQFDYEKPFTDKIDYHMTQLNGIPIAVLSGIGSTSDDELYKIISGADFSSINNFNGIGQTPSREEELKSIYDHLVRTRDYILSNPKSVIASGGAATHLQMLNYAISNWNTPNRDNALDILAQEEERWNRHNGISGLEGEEEINGLGAIQISKKFFGKVKEAVKKAGEGIKKVVQTIVKYNPVSLAVRGGFLLAMKINLLNMGSKLYPAYLTQAEAAKRGISQERWQRSKNALARVENLFVNKLQGQADKLKNAITTGRAARQVRGFGQLGEVATVTSVVAAAAPLIEASQQLKSAGLTEAGEDAPADEKGFIQKIKEWWKKVFGREDAVAPETVSDTEKQSNAKTGASAAMQKSADADNGASDDGGRKPDEESTWGKIKTFVKENPVATTVGSAAVVTGIALAINHAVKQSRKKKSPSPALSGTSRRRKKKAKPAHKKMKTIILK